MASWCNLYAFRRYSRGQHYMVRPLALTPSMLPLSPDPDSGEGLQNTQPMHTAHKAFCG